MARIESADQELLYSFVDWVGVRCSTGSRPTIWGGSTERHGNTYRTDTHPRAASPAGPGDSFNSRGTDMRRRSGVR